VGPPALSHRELREARDRRLSRPSDSITTRPLQQPRSSVAGLPWTWSSAVVGGDLVEAFDEAPKPGKWLEEPVVRYHTGVNHRSFGSHLRAELPFDATARLHQAIATTLEDGAGRRRTSLAR